MSFSGVGGECHGKVQKKSQRVVKRSEKLVSGRFSRAPWRNVDFYVSIKFTMSASKEGNEGFEGNKIVSSS